MHSHSWVAKLNKKSHFIQNKQNKQCIGWWCFTSTVMILSSFSQKMGYEWQQENVSCILRLSTTCTIIWNYSLTYYFRNQSVVLCLIYHRSFDVAPIDDINFDIKRLHYIEIDINKNALFWVVMSQFSSTSLVSNP